MAAISSMFLLSSLGVEGDFEKNTGDWDERMEEKVGFIGELSLLIAFLVNGNNLLKAHNALLNSDQQITPANTHTP